MAIPDPYKAAKPKTATNNTVPRSTGNIPAPTETKQPSLGVPKSGGAVPKFTVDQVRRNNLAKVPAPNFAPKSAISSPEITDWVAKQNEQYANLEKLVNTPFSYNPETDPAYQAQRQLAQLRAGDASRNALETANEKGILGSSMNVSQLGQIQQRAEQEAAAYIPEYRQQAYGQYQDQLRSVGELLGQARNLRGDRFNEAVTEGQLTGTYKPEDARLLERQLVDLKDSTEKNWSSMTQEQRTAARAQGDRLRSQLQGMGIDTSYIEANDTANSARSNMGSSGIRTLGGQAQDSANKAANWGAYMDVVGQTGNLGQGPQSNWGNLISQAGTGQNTLAGDDNQFSQGVTMAQLTGFLPDGTPTSAQQQQELSNLWMVAQQTGTIPNQLADLYGLQRGSRTQDAIAQAAQIGISQQNANTSAFSASNSAGNAAFGRLMDIWQATGSAPAGIPGVQPGTPYSGGRSNSGAEYDYRTDPRFSEGIAWVNADPEGALSELRSDAQGIIDELGYQGYQELLKAAESAMPKKEQAFIPGTNIPIPN